MEKNRQNNELQYEPWGFLKQFTSARIALGNSGISIPTIHSLKLRLAHAQARDAVYSDLSIGQLETCFSALSLPSYSVRSTATTRELYLENPDAGRRLSDESRQHLASLQCKRYEICFIIGDGLSAQAANIHACPLLRAILPLIQERAVAPVIIAQQARVALSDEIGMLMNAEIAVMFIGERPGLSSPDSLGIYITYNPVLGLTDERRNCISNIHERGISYATAAETLTYLLSKMFEQKISGVVLKDDRAIGYRSSIVRSLP